MESRTPAPSAPKSRPRSAPAARPRRATRRTTLRRPSANPHIARSANSSARSRSAADALRSSRLIELTFFDRRSKKGGFRLLSLACFFYLLHPNTQEKEV